ncbi:MAG: hypothetical protein JXQ90_08245 [Cyclobacteriaceae bacterium]
MKYWLFSSLCYLSILTMAQDALPYSQIPDYPESYTSSTVAARVVDGLGFRYYWATEGLSDQDLAYQPSVDAQTVLQTIDHILGLTDVLLNTVKSNPHTGTNMEGLSFEEKRKKTLQKIEEASNILKQSNGVEEMKMIFQGGNGSTEFPFWNLLNGPLSDAIYHTGQIVTFRRTTGNPINPNISVLRGIKRD